jgi:hypothetical protein
MLHFLWSLNIGTNLSMSPSTTESTYRSKSKQSHECELLDEVTGEEDERHE